MARRPRYETHYDPTPLLAFAQTMVDAPCKWADHITDNQLAEVLGVSQKTVLRWRLGYHHVRASTIEDICDRLGNHPAEIYGRYWLAEREEVATMTTMADDEAFVLKPA